MASRTASQHYHSIVDIGSNGIRFSISDLSPPTSRIIPTIYQDRSGVSLYDAQHSTSVKGPISPIIIRETVAALLRFKRTCQDFGVHDSNVRVVATEATRNAINRDHLLGQIKEATGWDVQLLAKEEEGRLGAMGIASSVGHLDGICMDMGGGSVQMTWVTKDPNRNIEMGPSVSFPYGAAALMSDLSKISSQGPESLHIEIASKLQNALENDLHIPTTQWKSANQNHGFNLYLSGGGFRGWGHVLMSQDDVQPYPIPIINGYTVFEPQFYSGLESASVDSSIFRISSRRASQVPAVQTLVKALKQAQLPISQVTFAQGGVREGLLYSGLPPAVRAQNPLVASTIPNAPTSAAQLTGLLRDAIPYEFEPELLEATVNLLFVHASLPKDIRAAAALRSTTTGILAGAHGLSHRDRQLIALILCERWGGDVSNVDAGFLHSLQNLQKPLSWWTKYIGRVANGIAMLFPAGVVRDDERTVTVEAGFPSGKDLDSADRCWINLIVHRSDVAQTVRAWATDLETLGKKKNWADGKKGLKVDVEVKLNAKQGQYQTSDGDPDC